MKPEKSAEVIVGHSWPKDRTGRSGKEPCSSMKEPEPEKKIEISEVDLPGSGRKPRRGQINGSSLPGSEGRTNPSKPELIETMLERDNMFRALQAVERNQGAAGIDGLEVSQMRPYLREHWARTKEQLLDGTYEPKPVRRVDIPKPGGGTRTTSPWLIHTFCETGTFGANA